MQDMIKRSVLLDMIYDAINTAPAALARVALYVAQDPEIVLGLSVAELAHNTDSGSASIVRFCRMLGFSGFREFKQVGVARPWYSYPRGNSKEIPNDAPQGVDGAFGRCEQKRLEL